MVVPGYPPENLEESFPGWVPGLTDGNLVHCLHVVRGLSPDEAVELVGGEVLRHLEPGALPDEAEDEWHTPAHAVAGIDPDDDLLLAGRRGEWTFVLDTAMITTTTRDGEEMACALSADGRVAAGVYFSVNGDTGLVYAEDGEATFALAGTYDPDDADDVPGALRPFVLASVDPDTDPDDLDDGLNARIVCALAGLTWSAAELRAQSLVLGRVVTSAFYDFEVRQAAARDTPVPEEPPLTEPPYPVRYVNDAAAAIQELSTVIDADPTSWQSLELRAQVLADIGGGALALADFDRAVRVGPHQMPTLPARPAHALALAQVGDHSRALLTMDTTLRYLPNSGWAHLRMAQIHLLRGNPVAMRSPLTRALECDEPALTGRQRALAESLLRLC